MFQTSIIVFREILEIALITGILAAATKNVPHRGKWILLGLIIGIIGSVIVALFTENISELFNGTGQELFNASILITCSAMISYTVIWMNKYARSISANLKKLGKSVSEGDKSIAALLPVVALSVLREGSEIVLFTYGSYSAGEAIKNIIAGAMIGFAAGASVGCALYYGIIKASGRYFFIISSWLLIFLAAGMVAQALGFLTSGGFVPELIYPIWDSSGFISEHSLSGKIFHLLIGYIEKPSGIQVLGYSATILFLFIGLYYDKLFPRSSG